MELAFKFSAFALHIFLALSFFIPSFSVQVKKALLAARANIFLRVL